MSKCDRSLGLIDVPTPCQASWAEMAGDDRIRHCEACRLDVHNLSAMTADEARNLLRQHQGRCCVRFDRNSDGSVLTRDQLRAGTRIPRTVVAVLGFAVFILFYLASLWTSDSKYDDARFRGPAPGLLDEFCQYRPIRTVLDYFLPPPTSAGQTVGGLRPMPEPMMGKVLPTAKCR
jgi:hypothetical protein